MEINLLRAFKPEEVAYGLDRDTSDKMWATIDGIGDVTLFQTKDQYILVIFSWNPILKSVELSFMTSLKSKVISPFDFMEYATYIPDEDMPLDPNRGTDVFRKVTYIVMQAIHKYDQIAFYGATPFLDRVYTRVANMGYIQTLLADHGLVSSQDGKVVYFTRVAR